jgi:hypothetical protein
MSVIKAGTTLTTAYTVEADTTGALEFKTGPSATLAMSISSSGVVTFPATTGFDIASANITNLTATSLTVSAATYLATASGSVGIGTTSPVGKLTTAYPAGANAPTTVTAANTYLQLGSAEYGASNNGKFMIGFGYTDALVNTNSPAYIGYEEVSTSGDTFGNLTFYTRSVTTDTAPDKRMTIDSSGNLGLGVTPSAWSSSYKAFQVTPVAALVNGTTGTYFFK